MKYVFKEECKTILVAVLGHTKSYIHFRLQSEINFGMAECCHYQCTLRDLIFPSRHTYVDQNTTKNISGSPRPPYCSNYYKSSSEGLLWTPLPSKDKKISRPVNCSIQFPPFYRPSTALTFIMKFLVISIK